MISFDINDFFDLKSEGNETNFLLDIHLRIVLVSLIFVKYHLRVIM